MCSRVQILRQHLQPTVTATTSTWTTNLCAAPGQFRLYNKVAVVTGAGSGIGRASAILFAKHGAKVLCSDINAKALASTVTKINTFVAEGGGSATGIVADVSQEDDTIMIVAKCIELFGRVDIFYANAGILPQNRPITETTIAHFQKTHSINLHGPFFALKYAAPVMQEQGEGSIIFTASIAGIRADVTPIDYTTSKAAVIAMARSAADQYAGSGVRVNAIVPGFVLTGITKQKMEEQQDSGLKVTGYDFSKFPPARSNQLASVALFLASEDSSYVTGQSIVADAGISNSMGMNEVENDDE